MLSSEARQATPNSGCLFLSGLFHVVNCSEYRRAAFWGGWPIPPGPYWPA